METLKTKYNCISAVYSETTDQNKPIDIYIKKAKRDSNTPKAVSYTHLTLPTICSV